MMATDSGQQSSLAFADYHLDLVNLQLLRGDDALKLMPRTFELLRYLAQHAQRLVTKRELLEVIWAGVVVGDAVLKEHVREIRRVLDDTPKSPRFIQTVHRLGYRFICPVERKESQGGTLHTAQRRAAASSETVTVVGRGGELERLAALLDNVESGRSRLVFVTGEAGIGKTTVVSEFLAAHCPSRRCWVASGQCVEQYGSGSAYLPFLEALEQLCRGSAGEDVLKVLRVHAPDWLQYLPSTCSREQPPGGSLIAVTPERLLRQVLDAASALTAIRPLVLVVEDLQWIDPSTLNLVAYLAQRSTSLRLLILGTYRAGDVRLTEHPVWALHQLLVSRDQCVEIALGKLLPRDVHGYLSRQFRQQRLPAEVAGKVFQVSSGNPLFMVRVVEDLVQRQVIHEQNGVWLLEGDLSGIETRLPDTVLSMIRWEVDRVTQRERDVLEAASVAGFAFTTRSIARVLQRAPVEVEALCSRWVRQRRFFDGGGGEPFLQQRMELHFSHSLYRQVIYDQLGPSRRSQLHGLFGLYLEKEHANRLRSVASALAMHFTMAADYERAICYGRMAGQQALAHGAYAEAVLHFESTLQLLERMADGTQRNAQKLAILLELRAPLVATLGYGAVQVEDLYDRATAASAALQCAQSSISVEAGRSLLFLTRGRVEDAVNAARHCLELAGSNDGWRKEAQLFAGVSGYYHGDFREAAGHIELALAQKEEGPRALFHNEACLMVSFYWSFLAWHRGEDEAARATARASLQRTRATEDPFAIAAALHHCSLVFLYARDAHHLAQHAVELSALCTDHGFAYYGHLAAANQAVAEVCCGKLDIGIAGLGQAISRLKEMEAGLGLSQWCTELAQGYASRGDIQAAFCALSDAFSILRTRGERFWEPELYRVHGELCAALPKRSRNGAVSLCGLSYDPEDSFVVAVARARQMGAASLERRATRSMALYRAKHGAPRLPLAR